MEHNPLNNYASRLAEIQLQRSPVATEITLIYYDVSRWVNDDLHDPNNLPPGSVPWEKTTFRDHYQDAPNSTDRVLQLEGTYKKKAIIKKDPEMHYIQFDFQDTLMEEPVKPWLISMTILGLPRLPHTDDRVQIEGKLYTISQVNPANRKLDGLISLLIYPEHTDVPQFDVKIDKYNDNCYSFTWTGSPIKYWYGMGPEPEDAFDFRSFIPNPPDGTAVISVTDGNTIKTVQIMNLWFTLDVSPLDRDRLAPSTFQFILDTSKLDRDSI